MFELEAAFDRWRTRAASSGISGDALAELEDHLREDVAAHVARGRTAQEAWRLAVIKLGDPATLAPQFHTVERLSTLDRTALGLIVAAVAGLMITGLAWLIFRGPIQADTLLTLHVVTITLGYGIGLAAAPIAAWCTARTLFSTRRVPRLSNAAIELIRSFSLFAAASTVLGFVLASLWSAQQGNRFFLADAREFGALAIIALTTYAAYTASRRHLMPRITLAIALTNGGLILACWLGPPAHELGYPPLFTTLAIGGLALGLTLAALTLAFFHRHDESAADQS